MKVAAFTKYDRRAASTRQRLLQYIPTLNNGGIKVDYHPLLDDDYIRSLASGRPYPKVKIARAYLRRIKQLMQGPDCDVIWVYAELFPYLPAAFERLAFRSGKPVVYDLDDAFFHLYDDSSRTWVRRAFGGKLAPLMRGAAACCCGNRYLHDYVSQFCEKSIVLPTVVDTQFYAPAGRRNREATVTIGWIGSPSTWSYVRPLLPALEDLARRSAAKIKIVGAGAGATVKGSSRIELVDWSEEREIADVQSMDIGIMPLPNEKWARGKSGYKLIQYMACGLPVVASPVGVNSEIVTHGINGLLADGEEEWLTALSRLIDDPELRARMGREARRRVEERYSLASQAPRVVGVLLEAAASS